VQITVDGEEKTETREIRRVYEQRWSTFTCWSYSSLHQPAIPACPRFNTDASWLLFLFMGEQSLSVKYIHLSLIFLPVANRQH
jgi:hypothetical protein